jgi:hypothetical protein
MFLRIVCMCVCMCDYMRSCHDICFGGMPKNLDYVLQNRQARNGLGFGYVYMHACLWTMMSLCVCVHVYMRAHVCIRTSMCDCAWLWVMHVCIHVCMCVYMCACVFICVYVHGHKNSYLMWKSDASTQSSGASWGVHTSTTSMFSLILARSAMDQPLSATRAMAWRLCMYMCLCMCACMCVCMYGWLGQRLTSPCRLHVLRHGACVSLYAYVCMRMAICPASF